MKIRVFNSTLSCILKCIGFFITMINKKIVSGLFILTLLSGCASPTAMIGPAYSLTSSGNILQAGLSYGSNEMITMYTGKTPIENIQEIGSIEKNVQKKTLQSQDFYILVKNKIEKTSGMLKLSNQ